MGSWPELDARDNTVKLTPPLAFVVALTHMAGADGVYMEEEEGSLAAYLPRHGLGNMSYDELMDRADTYLRASSLDAFLAEAPAILSDEQKMCILTNMIDAALADGETAPEEKALFRQVVEAFGFSEEQVRPYLQGIVLKNRLTLFNP